MNFLKKLFIDTSPMFKPQIYLGRENEPDKEMSEYELFVWEVIACILIFLAGMITTAVYLEYKNPLPDFEFVAPTYGEQGHPDPKNPSEPRPEAQFNGG